MSQQSLFGNGSQATFQGGPQNVQLGLGIWPYSEIVAVQYEGIVAGIINEPLDAGLGAPRDGVWPLSINSRTAVEKGYVEPGDIVVPVDGTNTECQYGFPILPGEDGGLLDLRGSVPPYPRAGARQRHRWGLLDGGGVLVLSDGTIPTIGDCPPMLSFNVRSSGLAPQSFTVTGTFSGWLGRLAARHGAGWHDLFQVGENTHTAVRPLLEAERRRRNVGGPAHPGGLLLRAGLPDSLRRPGTSSRGSTPGWTRC